MERTDQRPLPPQLLEISDDDEEEFVDVRQSFSPPHNPPSELAECLRNLGVRPRREWLDSCIRLLTQSNQGFLNMALAQQAEMCLAELFFTDFTTAADAILPPDLHALHATDIQGPFLLQVDEITNISSPFRDRYKEAPAGNKRCLKLSMTDGVQRVFGIEYRAIRDLMVLMPAGIKIALRNVHVRRGLLMLVPEVIDVLGGVVEHLESACQRLVEEVNKPPRGKRNRRGEDVLNLASRALKAAWPSDCSNNIPVTDTAVQREFPSAQLSSPEVTVIDTGGDTYQRTPLETVTGSESISNHQHNELVDMAVDMEGLDLIEEEIDHQLLETEESKIPYTYLAFLKARKQLEPVVQGRIKCILTGVKEFQFKDCDKFKLLVYIDDGSLISEVLISDQVVQKIIGNSPREVTALLTSGNRQHVDAIKEVMKCFQVQLRKFEGQMVIEISDDLPVPVVLEMKDGCDDEWPWLLFGRCKRLFE